jgi:Ca2+-binding EF-hand superfamily protein
LKKAELHAVHSKTITDKHPEAVKLDSMELFRTFKKYDRNQNGTLEFPEYTLCLEECSGLTLSKPEIITMALQADMDGSASVDFEEFMKHFHSVLDMIHFN